MLWPGCYLTKNPNVCSIPSLMKVGGMELGNDLKIAQALLLPMPDQTSG